jgi:microcystin-dependent protein
LSVTGTTTVGGAFGVSGRASGNGMIPAGFMATFPKVPSRFATGGSGTAGACDWVECDGSLYPMSSFPDLGAFLGSTFGGDGVTNFGMPNLTSTGRFVRSRSSGHAEGTSQSNAIKSHTASVSGTTADHGHTATVHEGSGHSHTGGQAHTRSFGVAAGSNNIWGGAADSTDPATTGLTVTLDTPGGLAVSGTASYSGDTETRPEAFTAVICLKS